MRVRRVSRRGLRSTVSNLAGSSAITSRRCTDVMVSHAPISADVRPQPKQKPVFMSMEQTRMQGDSIVVKVCVLGLQTPMWGNRSPLARAGRIARKRGTGYSDAMTSPLDDFRALVAALPPVDNDASSATLALFENAGIHGSRLVSIAAQLAGVTGGKPVASRPQLAMFAGAHGVARNGVSERRLDATMAAVSAFGSGDAPASYLCAANMVGLKVYDLALHMPTGDIVREPAMDERTCAATLAFGMEAIAGGPDIVIISAVRSAGDDVAAHTLLGALLPDVQTGVGLSQNGLIAVADALARHKPGVSDALASLADLGGREIAACAGAIVAARSEKLPLILDGLTALTAAAVLHAMNPDALRHCLLAEASDASMQGVAARLGLEPLVATGTHAGEGTSGVVAVSVVKDALTMRTGLAAHARTARH